MTDMTSRPTAAAPTGSRPTPPYLLPTLTIDGVGSAVIGLALLAAPGWLADGLALSSSAPVRMFGALFVLNGLLNLRVARSTTRGSLVPPIAIDTVFAVVMLALAVLDPSGAQTWARWVLFAAAVFSADVAALKAWGRSRLAP